MNEIPSFIGQHHPVVKPSSEQRGCAAQCSSTVGLAEGIAVGLAEGLGDGDLLGLMLGLLLGLGLGETLGEHDDFNWRDYEAKKLMPPFLPSVRSPTDTSNFTTPPDWDEPVTPYRGYKRYDPFFQKW